MGQIDGIEMEGVFDGVVEGIIDGESLSAQHIERQAKNRNETGSNVKTKIWLPLGYRFLVF